jgi:hypothetical protein
MTVTRDKILTEVKELEHAVEKFKIAETEDRAIVPLVAELLEGIEARWRDCSVDPPPKIDGTVIQVYHSDFAGAPGAFDSLVWIGDADTGMWDKSNDSSARIGTYWKPLTPPKGNE